MLYDENNNTQNHKLITADDITVTPLPMNNINFNGSAIQTKNRYVTAMQVLKPRNLNKVISKCVEEASIAGEEFIYSWKQGGSIIEGLTIGAALSIVRNFGNSMVDVEVTENEKAYIFTAYFCDLETGFNISRSFRQNKQSPKSKYGKDIYEGDRGVDIIFQIGQSKAIRNVVLNAIPRWLASKVLEEAKNNAMATINNMGEVKARELLLRKIDNLQVNLSNIEAMYGKAKSWDKVKLVQLSSALKSLENGYEDEDTLFPATIQKTSSNNSDFSKDIGNNDEQNQPSQLSKRARIFKINQEILELANADYKQAAILLEKHFGRKFKLNASFAAQLSDEELDQIDGNSKLLLKPHTEQDQKVA
jgi:hypothetical protein